MQLWICLTLIVFISSTTSNIREYALDDNQMTLDITVRRKDVFYIKMKGNPTTGYEWEVLNLDEFDAYIIPLNIDEEHNTTTDVRPDVNPEGFVGGESTYYFKFQVSKRRNIRNSTIKFVYKRSWETTPNAQIKKIRVHIR